MPQRPHVLWVTSEPPDRTGGGGNIRQSHLLRGVAAWADVDLIVAGGQPDVVVSPLVSSITEVPLAQRRTPPGPIGRRVRALGDGLLPGGPSELRDTRAVRGELLRALRDRSPHDVVIVEHTGLAPLVSDRRPGEKWLLTMHNVPSVSGTQALALAQGRRRAWLWQREIASARTLESRAVTEFDAVVTVSDTDADALPGRSIVVPNGVDLGDFRPTPLPGGATVVFTGTLNYLPNVDGAQWFCREVWPLVRQQVPTARLIVAGRSPVADVTALETINGVELVADPPDMSPSLAAADVAVVPLRLGSGTRLKALEAMAAGRPVVGTTVGLAGLGIVDGRDALVRDDAQAFAAATIGLLTDRAEAERLATLGPAFAERFAWPLISRQLVEVLDRLIAEPGRRPG